MAMVRMILEDFVTAESSYCITILLSNYLWISVLDGGGGGLKFCFRILRTAYGLSNMVNTVFIITLWLQKLTLVDTQCGAEETE